jgi:hypothetical protein
MFDYILSNGSSIDEITKHDDIDPKKRTGPSSYCGFLIKKTNGLLLKDSIHKNVLDIILMSYDILLKYGILIDNPVHPIYDLIKYFNIKIKINKYECCICMVEDDIKLEQLHCSHFICINCAINIQEDDKIVCPFCRKINDYSDNPYLIRLALYHLALGDITLENLLQNAPTNAGIYEEHLRRFLHTFKINPHLTQAFLEVVTAQKPVSVETISAYQLYSIGLVKRIGDKLTPSCQLYQQYFREHLQN